MKDFEKRLVEVDVVLDHLSDIDYQKIPEDIIDAIKSNKDPNYKWVYDEAKELKDQDLSRDTIAILSYLNMEYLLNENQRKEMEMRHLLNELRQNEKNKGE